MTICFAADEVVGELSVQDDRCASFAIRSRPARTATPHSGQPQRTVLTQRPTSGACVGVRSDQRCGGIPFGARALLRTSVAPLHATATRVGETNDDERRTR